MQRFFQNQPINTYMDIFDPINAHLPSYQKWLNSQPRPDEIRLNDDGSQYIPIEFIKPKLDFLSPTWGTTNFQHHYTEMPVFDKAGNKLGITLWASGSVQLHLYIKEEKRTPLSGEFFNVEEIIICRTLTGSATFDVQKYYPNNNWAQTCLSLCIVAAAKELGTFFGKDLNKEVLTVPNTERKKKDSDKLRKTLIELGKQI